MGCHSLLQGIFLTQGLNTGLSYCRQILYHLSHQGSPKNVIGDPTDNVNINLTIIFFPLAMSPSVSPISLHACMLSHFTRVQLCNPMDCSPPGSFVHGISQARILEWVAISFSRGSSRPRDQTQVSCLTGEFFTTALSGKSKT